MHQINRNALRRAVSVAAKTFNDLCFKSMRDPVYASQFGVRPWPEVLTEETVASWIAANVGYAIPWEAHTILKAYLAENTPTQQ